MDSRREAARYYDLEPGFPDDIPFYREALPSRVASVLELGCGTGRVLLGLASHCADIWGMDRSEAMLAICRERVPATVRVIQGDISDFDLGRTFDLIIAPYRVFQNLETDEEVHGCLRGIRSHLGPDGTAIIDVFRPWWDREGLLKEWPRDGEIPCWEQPVEGGRVVCTERRDRVQANPLVIYPELIYRRYEGDALRDEAVMRFPMRCYYPDELRVLIEAQGFTIIHLWGGYDGEPYGTGPELLVQFRRRGEGR
jgi:SAM-dependent methyltransferase